MLHRVKAGQISKSGKFRALSGAPFPFGGQGMSSAGNNRQWLRQAQVVFGTNGSGLLVSKLRIQFEIIKTIDPAPNTAQIKIFNLAPNNEQSVLTEYEQVMINAGYQGTQRLIFEGNIKHAFHFREKADLITQIEAADGDKDYRNAVMNLTLAAGTTPADLVTKAVASMTGGTTLGYNGITGTPRIRGKVISGMTRDVLSRLGRETGSNWSIQDGQLQIVAADAVLPNQAIVVNAATGMLKAPEINDRGIRVTCLLNPQIRINGVLQLDNNDIMLKLRKQRTLSKNTRKQTQPTTTVKLNADGLYKVIRVDHRGDTHSSQWETESYCIGLNQSITATTQPAPVDVDALYQEE
jgi:hypothetical protein